MRNVHNLSSSHLFDTLLISEHACLVKKKIVEVLDLPCLPSLNTIELIGHPLIALGFQMIYLRKKNQLKLK